MAENSPALADMPAPPGLRAVWPGWLVAFAAAFALYAATASRGPQWQDPGVHIYRIVMGELVNPLGLALSHPVHHWLGRFGTWLYPAGPAVGITLVSALAAAITVANLFGYVRYLTPSAGAAAVAAASLAVAHTFWQMATVAEAYTLATAFLSSEIFSLTVFTRSRRPVYLWLAFGLNGLAFANHNAALLTTPVLAAVTVIYMVRGHLRLRDVLLCALLWLVASLPYTWLIAAELSRSGDVVGVMQSALFGNSYSNAAMNLSISPRRLLISFCFIGLNFPNLTIPLAIVGLVAAREYGPAPRRVLGASLIIHFVFAIRYPVVDQHMFFLPTYLLTTAFAGLGLAHIIQAKVSRARAITATAVVLLAATPILYLFVPDIARRFNVLSKDARNKPFRDDYAYLFTPWTGLEGSAEAMARGVLKVAGDDALIIAPDRMASPAIWYEARVSGKSGVEIIGAVDLDQVEEAVRSGRRVVLVPKSTAQEPPTLSAGTWRREGDVYVLEPAKDD